MNIELLQELGLTKSQAITYLTLVQHGAMTPPDIAKKTQQTRTNTYMILARLEELSLVERVAGAHKVTYQAENPITLEDLADKRKKHLYEVEERVKANMPQLLSYFYSITEKPGVRLLQGEEGVEGVYNDILRAKEDIYVLRSASRSESRLLSSEFFSDYKKKRAALGIKTELFAQDIPSARNKPATDKDNLIERHWVSPEKYNQPVEIDVFGDQVAFFIFGEEIMSVVLNSKPAAEAMRQVLDCMKNDTRQLNSLAVDSTPSSSKASIADVA